MLTHSCSCSFSCQHICGNDRNLQLLFLCQFDYGIDHCLDPDSRCSHKSGLYVGCGLCFKRCFSERGVDIFVIRYRSPWLTFVSNLIPTGHNLFCGACPCSLLKPSIIIVSYRKRKRFMICDVRMCVPTTSHKIAWFGIMCVVRPSEVSCSCKY